MRKRLLLAITAFLLACTLVNAETLEERVDRLEKELRETKEELQKQIAEKQVPAPVVAAAPALDISKLTDGFEFHGYGRAGVLINQDGDKGNAFKVQDEGFAQKYRLGNEDDTYAELELVKKFDVNGAKVQFITCFQQNQVQETNIKHGLQEVQQIQVLKTIHLKLDNFMLI